MGLSGEVGKARDNKHTKFAIGIAGIGAASAQVVEESLILAVFDPTTSM
jgi:hypothetical protein